MVLEEWYVQEGKIQCREVGEVSKDVCRGCCEVK